MLLSTTDFIITFKLLAANKNRKEIVDPLDAIPYAKETDQ